MTTPELALRRSEMLTHHLVARRLGVTMYEARSVLLDLERRGLVYLAQPAQYERRGTQPSRRDTGGVPVGGRRVKAMAISAGRGA